jgi:hypothetical protein
VIRSWFHRLALASAGAAVLMLASLHAQDPKPAPKPFDPTQPTQPGVEVLDSGPVHEAFAQPGAAIKGPGVLAPKAPPPAVPEIPPDVKPEGNNVVWVGGYWHWDEAKKDYIWISGFWRNAPAGREWQPGAWKQDGAGYRYVSGFWKQQNVVGVDRNLPKPPDSVESGPSTPPPHPDAVWVPGHWEYRPSGYGWRGGYWGEPEGNLLWTPPQYLWNTTGYTCVPGYWDYCLEDRGLLYAPVYFSTPLWNTPGWCYRPSLAINVGFGGGWGWGWGGFYSSLFVGPHCNNFYFGHRYGGWWNWAGGYRPWCWSGKGFYNPVYKNYCWLNRGNKHWSHNVHKNFAASAVGVTPRGGFNRTDIARTGGTRTGGRPGGDVAVNRGGRDGIRDGIRGNNGLVQPARQVLDSQQAARRVQPTPTGGLARTDALNRAGRNEALSGRIAMGQRSISGGHVTSNRGGTLNPGTLDPRGGRAGSVNVPDLGRSTTRNTTNLDRLPSGRSLSQGDPGDISRRVSGINRSGATPDGSFSRSSRGGDLPPSINRGSSGFPSGRIGSLPPDFGGRSSSLGRSSIPSGSGRGMGLPSSGGRSSIGSPSIGGSRGGMGGAIGGSRGGSAGGSRGGRR